MPIRKGQVSAAALFALLLGVTRPPAPNPTDLLRQAVGAYSKYSYIGQVQNTDFGTNRTDSVLFRIEHRAPDSTRRWYLAPESLYGDSIISLGDTSYDIDAHNGRIIFTRDDALDDQVAEDDNFGLLLSNYRAVSAPDDNVAGRRTLNVMLINKYTGQTVMRISVDAETKLVLQKEQYSPSGAISQQMRFEQIRYTNNIPQELFHVPRSGYAHINGPSHGLPSNDLQAVVHTAGFQAFGPKYLPEGFVPVAGDVSEIKGVRTLHLLYSDGLRTVSLFENARGAPVDLSKYTAHEVSLRGRTAQYVQDGTTMLLSWGQGNLHFALVGELSRQELVQIASSVAP